MAGTVKRTFTELYDLLDHRTRWGLIGLFSLGLVTAALEMVGLGLLLPLLQLAVDPGQGTGIAAVDSVLGRLPGSDPTEQFSWLALFVFLFYLAKNGAIGWVLYVQKRFAHGAEARFTTRLFGEYLARPYSFHVARHSAEMIRTITRSAPSVFLRILIPLLEIAMEILLSIAAIAVLIMVDPLATLVGGGAVGGTLAIFVWTTRRRLSAWGQRMEELSADILRWVQHGLGAIKEVLVLGRRDYFVSGFHRAAAERAQLGAMSDLLPQLPRLLAEVVAAAGLLAVLVLLVERSQGLASAIPVLGVFAAAALRVMPSMNRIAQRAQVIRHGLPALGIVLADVRTEAAAPDSRPVAPLSLQEEARLEGVTVRYPNRSEAALDNVTMSLRRGEAVGVVGATGAGKTTLADVLLGLVRPDNGRLMVDGQDVTADPRPWQRAIGFVPQNVFLTDDSIRRNIALGVEDDAIDEDRIRAAVRQARIDELVDSLPEGLATKVGERGATISGGQRQRIGIARALYHGPAVLILDEATSALDHRTENEITGVIRNLHGNKTLLIIAHRLSTLRHCDRLIVLDHGRLVGEGPYETLAQHCAPFREMLRHGEYLVADEERRTSDSGTR
jgi:ABC-type multidrug transport system fused ATPase/permease subunit